MACPREEMEVKDDPSSPLSTPTRQRGRKGEEAGDVDESSKELSQVVMDCLRADGLSASGKKAFAPER